MATVTKPAKKRIVPKSRAQSSREKGRSPAQQLLAFAREKVSQSPSWTDLSNSIYGIGGPFSRLFPTTESRTTFAKSAEYRAVSELIDNLPGPDDERAPTVTSSGKLLVRLPASIHAALIKEADLEGVSVNQLVVAKLSAQLRTMAFGNGTVERSNKQS